MKDLLLQRWGSDIVVGDREAPKPSLIGFLNTEKAVEMLRKHIRRNSRIAVHCDVDVDGIGSGYILKKFLRSQGANNTLFLINKDKEHGIQGKHVNYFNNVNNCDLLVILDSSTNEVDIIKQFNNDVLVVDHHEMLHGDTEGVTHDGEHSYVIVNNMIENKNGKESNDWLKRTNPNTSESIGDYEVDRRMSGGLVLYELLRIYCEAYRLGDVLENLMLFQWVGVTLFSDAVQLVPDRNQWYIENTVQSMYVESGLQAMLAELNQYKATLDKSFIVYTLVPIINKAMRAGSGGEALDIVLNRPKDIKQLSDYGKKQDEAVKACIVENEVYRNEFIVKDIGNKGVSRNYCGVIAARLCGSNHKNAAVYIVEDGIANGSFRGRYADVDYRKYFEEYEEGIYAQGHKPAFGFKVRAGLLEEIMGKLHEIEKEVHGDSKPYLTAGRLEDRHKGIHHIDDIDQFKKEGNFWRLAVANAKLSSSEHLNIIVPAGEVVLKDQIGKLLKYEALGLECKAFEPIITKMVEIYVEYSKTIEVYIKNHSDVMGE